MIEVCNLSVSISELKLLDNVSFRVNENDRFMIVGPNGAGKSTLIHAISQGIPYQGEVFYNGKNLASMKTKHIAKCIGFLSQKNEVNYSFTVEEVVSLGRYAYTKELFHKTKNDTTYINEALEMTGLYEKRKQSVLSLSGGELQRTFLAQLFAQDPKVLLLDEPTNHLDIQYQTQIFTLIDKWADSKKRAVVSVVHDLSLAAYYGTKFLLLDRGNVVSLGTKEDVLTIENLSNVYHMNVHNWMKQLYHQWN